MKKLLLPVILLLLGVGSGVGAGLFLAPPVTAETDMAANPCGDVSENVVVSSEEYQDEAATTNEYAKLSNQFIVPIVDDGLVSALVVISLSVEVSAGYKDSVYLAEPKLRDGFLQAMFDHANIGGFSGNFTSAQNLRPLREDLTRLAKTIVPGVARDVLIIDIVRQDV